MRRALPYAIALLLGIGSALLVGCDNGTRGGIPAADADQLTRDLDTVRSSVRAGDCQNVDSDLLRIDTAIDRLRADVDDRLVSRLREASDRLNQVAFRECNTNRLNAQTPAQTETEPETETQTQETTTTVAPPTETETTPTETETTPTETTPTTTSTVPDDSGGFGDSESSPGDIGDDSQGLRP